MKSIRTVIIFIGLIVLGSVAIWFVRDLSKPKIPTTQEMLAKQNQRDLDTLNAPRADEQSIYAALSRLGQQLNPTARQIAVRRLKDPSAMIRAGVATSLGHFEDEESLQALKTLAADPAESVRVATLRALSFRRLPVREELLKTELAKSGLSEKVRIAAAASLLTVSQNSATKELVFKELALIAKNSKDFADRAEALYRAADVFPDRPELVQIYRDTIEGKRDPELMPQAIHHLSALRDPKLKALFATLVKNSNPRVRMAALQVLPGVCPVERWTILADVISGDRDRDVVSTAIP